MRLFGKGDEVTIKGRVNVKVTDRDSACKANVGKAKDGKEYVFTDEDVTNISLTDAEIAALYDM